MSLPLFLAFVLVSFCIFCVEKKKEILSGEDFIFWSEHPETMEEGEDQERMFFSGYSSRLFPSPRFRQKWKLEKMKGKQKRERGKRLNTEEKSF